MCGGERGLALPPHVKARSHTHSSASRMDGEKDQSRAWLQNPQSLDKGWSPLIMSPSQPLGVLRGEWLNGALGSALLLLPELGAMDPS